MKPLPRKIMVLIAALGLAGCADESESASTTQDMSEPSAAVETADEQDVRPDSVTVVGVGTVDVVPDVAWFTVGVEIEADDVATAFDEAATRADAVVSALLDAGVEEDRIQTTRLDVRPARDDPGPDRPVPAVTGYVVTNFVRVTSTDPGSIGDVVAAAVGAGGDAARVQGIEFGVEDATAAREAAREAAWEDARERARQYAGLAGRELGTLRSLDETVGSEPRPLAVEDVAAAGRAPISSGTETVEVVVRAVWTLR